MSIDAVVTHPSPSSCRTHPRISIILIEFSQIFLEFSRSFTRNSMQRRRGVYGIKLVDELSHNLEQLSRSYFGSISFESQTRLWTHRGTRRAIIRSSFLPFPLFFQRVLGDLLLVPEDDPFALLGLDRSMGGESRRREQFPLSSCSWSHFFSYSTRARCVVDRKLRQRFR